MPYTLPDLEYAYNALEPYIDEQTMRVHHDKHHRAYMDKFAAAIKNSEIDGKEVSEILRDPGQIPKDIRQAVINNGGGYANHTLFWKIMGPGAGGEPGGRLAEEIKKTFGSFENFKEHFTNAALSQFGSGWAWLVVEDGKLAVLQTSNQESPVSLGKNPILCLDVWEHAYYLKYQNKRPEYVKNFWNVINWRAVENLYKEATS